MANLTFRELRDSLNDMSDAQLDQSITAFVIAGGFVGLSNEAAFSAAIGRRLREVLVGITAVISWYTLFNKKKLNFN